MKSNHGFKLGDLVKDRITGYKGVVIAITDWINGCVRITIQPEGLKDGKPYPSETFDVESLDIVKAGKHAPSRPSGGPCDDKKALSR